MKVVLDGTYDEVTEMLKHTTCDYNSVQTLCTFVAQLKKCNVRNKEKIQELKKAKTELTDQIEELMGRFENLKSGSITDVENSRPLRGDPKSFQNESVEYIDLDEPYQTSMALGADVPFKVLDQRKFERRAENSKISIFSKSLSKFSSHQDGSQRLVIQIEPGNNS